MACSLPLWVFSGGSWRVNDKISTRYFMSLSSVYFALFMQIYLSLPYSFCTLSGMLEVRKPAAVLISHSYVSSSEWLLCMCCIDVKNYWHNLPSFHWHPRLSSLPPLQWTRTHRRCNLCGLESIFNSWPSHLRSYSPHRQTGQAH